MKNTRKQAVASEPAVIPILRIYVCMYGVAAIVRGAWSHLQGQLLSRYLRLRHVMPLRSIRPRARYLEMQVFPDLRQGGIGWLRTPWGDYLGCGVCRALHRAPQLSRISQREGAFQ